MELLWLAAAIFLCGLAFTILQVKARGRPLPTRFNLAFNLAAFTSLTWFLSDRGRLLGRCPITTPFEMLVFLAWATVLGYLIVGPAYRLSLMGGFTSPFAMTLLLGALLGFPSDPQPRGPKPGGWIELHGALSMLAYGVFALACVAGVMYLVQRRQLIKGHLGGLSGEMPAVQDLAIANRRLLVLGLVVLTAGLGAGFMAGPLPSGVKLTWAIGVWFLYASLLVHRWVKPEATSLLARLSIGAFLLSLAGLWSIAHFVS